MNKISGTVDSVVYSNEENGFAIIKISPDFKSKFKQITALGTIPDIQVGEYLTARGKWVHNRTYGEQFQVEDVIVSNPTTLENIQQFLPSILTGIGKVYAEKIIDRFGAKVFDIIENKSKLLESVPGIGKKKRLRIKKSWDRHRAMREIFLYLAKYGIRASYALKIYKQYGQQALSVIKENPYTLAVDIRGIGFLTADQIAQKLGIKKNAPTRIRAGIIHVLHEAGSDGHTCLATEDFFSSCVELLDISKNEIEDCLLLLINEEKIKLEKSSNEVYYFLYRYWHYEKNIAKKLTDFAQRPPNFKVANIAKKITDAEKKAGLKLAENQKIAVSKTLQNRVSIITGGPGVGKTTILRIIFQIVDELDKVVHFAAPTGRAAKRMTMSLAEVPTKRKAEAKTIHRLLEVNTEGGFFRGEENKLDGDFFVLDEASMIDVYLMSYYLDALPQNAHLLIVGDVDQLPSVGAGAFLQDAINSNIIPVIRLTEIYRQASGSDIISASHAINKGIIPESIFAKKTATDFYFVKKLTPESIVNALETLAKDRISAKFNFDPISDVQILTPMNRGLLGTTSLNEKLQESLNPKKSQKQIEKFNVVFRCGDKIIQTKNNYKKDVYNGDIGIITDIDTELEEMTVFFDNDKYVVYEDDELDEIKLAYAITIHKSQGSEFPVVLLPISNQHYIMLQRNLFYTGITRGKDLVMLIGEPKALEIATYKANAKKRCTFLKNFMLTIPLP